MGTPPIEPPVAPNFNPVGKVPAEIEKLYGGVPPLTCSVCPYAPPIDPLGKVLGVIVRLPLPVVNVPVTVSGAAGILNVQVFPDTLQDVGVPLHPPKLEPDGGVSVKITCVL